MIRGQREERLPDFSTDARRRPNIVSIAPIPQQSRRARLPRVFVVRDSLPNPVQASLLAPKTSGRPNGLRRNRLTKAARSRRQFASEADATAPSNRPVDRRKFRKRAERENRD